MTTIFMRINYYFIASMVMFANCSTSEKEQLKVDEIRLAEQEKFIEGLKEKEALLKAKDELLEQERSLPRLSKSQKKKLRTYNMHLKSKKVIGRIEIVEFPNFGSFKVQSRIDSGAKTCSLHAEDIEEKIIDGKMHVQFKTFDFEGKPFVFTREVVDMKKIRSTSGKAARRYVIREEVELGGIVHKVNINLNDRDKLNFKFLTGRNLLMGNYIVDPSHSHLLGNLE